MDHHSAINAASGGDQRALAADALKAFLKKLELVVCAFDFGGVVFSIVLRFFVFVFFVGEPATPLKMVSFRRGSWHLISYAT